MSGSVFFSGRRAFNEPSDMYVLGLNPAGDPAGPHTVRKNIGDVLRRYPDNWSAWRDERWAGRKEGRNYRQRRVLHLFDRIGRNPGEVPASETIFRRATKPSQLGNLEAEAANCWPFHEAVIRKLSVRVVICLGGRAGSLVRGQLDAHRRVDEFRENNRRRWRSRTHTNAQGLVVATLAHPSQVDWTVPATDPTGLVEAALVA